MKTKTLGFVGGGRITRIFLQAFQNKSLEFSSILVYEPNQDVVTALKKQFPEITVTDSQIGPAQQDLVFLAVHPPVMMETLNNIKQAVKTDSTVVSLAPKFTIEKIASVLHTQYITRMIPNATSYINEGYNPVCFHKGFSEEEKKSLMQLFDRLGKTIEVDEPKLEGYAMVSAMLPTYFWFQWKKIEELAIQMGFSETEARKVIRNTLKRSIQLYYKSSLSPDEVIDLIPVKPIGEHENEIADIYDKRIKGLYEKIKP